MTNDKPYSVFGVPIEGLSLDFVMDELKKDRKGPFWVVTANPEILLEAKKNEAYRKALNQADIRLMDGFGLWAVVRLFGGKAVHRVTGVDLAERILLEAQEQKWRVAFLGGENGEEREAADAMRTRYPSLQIEAEKGGMISHDGEQDAAGDEACQRLTMFDPQVLFVAFGHPKQEMWILKHIQDFPNLKVVVGVGGTFNVWANRLPRAPKFLRVIGLEWLWRLFLEPKRIGRILRAVFVFPALFLKERISKSTV